MKEEFPMRINKYLAIMKHSTRRGADALIEKGLVFINERKARLGDKVAEADKVEVRHKGERKKLSYFAYYKPKGIVTIGAGRGEKEIKDILPLKGLFPIGRLDKDSHGLIILTNDGRITDRLLNPKYFHEKEYRVKTKEKLRSSFKAKMEAGVKIEREMTRPARVEITGDKSFNVTLTEGKHHQIRRMCAALFQEVDDLQRVRIMNISLDKLQPGEFRQIEGKELETFLSSIGL